MRRVVRCFTLLVVALSLSACANLGAVREFAASSASMTGYTAVTERYFASVDHVLREMPTTADFANERAKAEALKREQADQKAALLKLHDTATGYMVALARLAGDDTFDLSGSIDAVSGKLVRVPNLGIGAKEIDAYASIAKTVTSWALAAVQAKEVKELARRHGDAMDTLLGGMQTVTALYETELKSERDRIRAFGEARVVSWSQPLASEKNPKNPDREDIESRREAVVAWSRRGYAMVAKEEADAVASAHAAAAGIAVVRAGHAEMLKNLDHLDRKDVVALLKKAVADLKSIRSNLKQL